METQFASYLKSLSAIFSIEYFIIHLSRENDEPRIIRQTVPVLSTMEITSSTTIAIGGENIGKAIPNMNGVGKILNNQVGRIAQSPTIIAMPCWTAQMNADGTITMNAEAMFCDKSSLNKPHSVWKIIQSKL